MYPQIFIDGTNPVLLRRRAQITLGLRIEVAIWGRQRLGFELFCRTHAHDARVFVLDANASIEPRCATR